MQQKLAGCSLTLKSRLYFPASLAAKNGHRTELWPLNVGANDVLCFQAWPINLPHSSLFPGWQYPCLSFVSPTGALVLDFTGEINFKILSLRREKVICYSIEYYFN